MLGKSRDPGYGRGLRRRYGERPNIEFLGMVDQFASDGHGRAPAESWIMINTATREAMTNAFLEAAAHGCAILSSVDPDGFPSQFGYHAARDDFGDGLAALLEGGRWRQGGRLARQHVSEVFRIERAIDLHLEAYRELMVTPLGSLHSRSRGDLVEVRAS